VLIGYLHFPPWGILVTDSWPPTPSVSEHGEAYWQEHWLMLITILEPALLHGNHTVYSPLH
jgi:hypothetical protein